MPLNEINSHAFRSFHHLFPSITGDESWFYSEEGYEVSFMMKDVHYLAYFDQRGGYRYSLHHYTGKEIPREAGDLLKRKFPDYQINIVTEITDGDNIVYLVRLVSARTIKTVSLCNGETHVIAEEAISDPAATAYFPTVLPLTVRDFRSNLSSSFFRITSRADATSEQEPQRALNFSES